MYETVYGYNMSVMNWVEISDTSCNWVLWMLDVLVAGMVLAAGICLRSSTRIIIIYVIFAAILLLRTWAIWALSRYVLVYLLVTDLVHICFSFTIQAFWTHPWHSILISGVHDLWLLETTPFVGRIPMCVVARVAFVTYPWSFDADMLRWYGSRICITVTQPSTVLSQISPIQQRDLRRLRVHHVGRMQCVTVH